MVIANLRNRWIIGRTGYVAAILCLMVAGCVPLPDEAGGTIPPPEIDTNVPPGSDPGDGDGGGGGSIGSGVFDVTIEAASLAIGGIAVEAVLTVVTEEQANGTAVVTEFTLRDTVNDPGATFGLSGGISLVSMLNGIELFTINDAGGGNVTASLRPTSGTTDGANIFIVQEGGGPFNPGELGVGYAVQSGSTLTFSINGTNVTGTLDLSGTPINTTGNAEVYVGTFAGTRRGS